MIYLKRSNIAVKKNRKISIGIILLFVLLFGLHFFFPRFYASVFYPVTSIIWKVETSVVDWLSITANTIRSKNSLVRENQALMEQIRGEKTALLILDTLKQENDNLKNILGRITEKVIILGMVLARPPVSPYDTLIIDRGSRDGIEVGALVYTAGDVLIGEIAEIYPHQSKVSLFSTPGKKINISFTGREIHTEARGMGGGNFVASVPVSVGIKEGDIVVLPDIKLHTLGVVESVIADSVDSFSTILFKTPINIYELNLVEVQIKQ